MASKAPKEGRERLLFLAQVVLLAIVALFLALPGVTGSAAWTYSIGGAIALVCFVEAVAVGFFIGLTRNRVFLKSGVAQDVFVLKYVFGSQRLIDFLLLFLLVSGVIIIGWCFCSGALGWSVSTHGSKYVLTENQAPKPVEIGVREFLQIKWLEYGLIPGSVSVVFITAAALSLRSVRSASGSSGRSR